MVSSSHRPLWQRSEGLWLFWYRPYMVMFAHTLLNESCLHVNILWYIYNYSDPHKKQHITCTWQYWQNTLYVPGERSKLHFNSFKRVRRRFPNKSNTSYVYTQAHHRLRSMGTHTHTHHAINHKGEVLIIPLHHTHSGSKGQLAVCCLSVFLSCPSARMWCWVILSLA